MNWPNDSVKFLNIQNFEVDLDRQSKLLIEYLVSKDVKTTYNDWIAIYPNGSNILNSVNVDLMVAFEFVLSDVIKKEERRYKMDFSLKGAKNLKYGQKYQFVYVSRSSDIYGISDTFEFRPPTLNKNSELSYSQENDDECKENLEDSPTQINDKIRKIDSQTIQPFIKEESGSYDKREAKKFINKFNNSKQVFIKKQTEIWFNNNSCLSPPISCSNCHRVAGLLRSQGELYNKIKSLAEINNDLRNQNADLQRQVELGQAACQKLSVSLMREQQAKLFYQAAAFERADYEYQIMVVEPYVPSLFVPTSRKLPVLGRHQAEDKVKVGCSVLKLKAIIGYQEEKIRSLTKEIAEMRMERAQKVTAVLKNIEEINNPNKDHATNKEIKINKE